METRLSAFADLVDRYGSSPSFPITAAVLNRNPHVARHLLDRGVELCVHGLVHNDLSKLPGDVQRTQIVEAVKIFRHHGIGFTGFRSPYLRYNTDTLAAVEASGFLYDSNLAFYWHPEASLDDLSRLEAEGLQRGLRFYTPATYPAERSLPRWLGRLVEIPVSLPDDEIMLDRMGWPPLKIEQAWMEMARTALDRGELLTLQLHPERALLLGDCLKSVLEFADSSGAFWIATMGRIAEWWRLRTDFKVEISTLRSGEYKVLPAPQTKADLHLVTPRSGSRRALEPGDVVSAPKKPIIGAGPGTPQNLMQKARDMGYFIEIATDSDAYPLYVDSESSVPDLERSLAELGHPLIADRLWPAPHKAALAITGDIDCLTLGDFLRRFREG
jgi:peptidoglycan/xylan/chitin deacetylase (PgdA/CDA1 family)